MIKTKLHTQHVPTRLHPDPCCSAAAFRNKKEFETNIKIKDKNKLSAISSALYGIVFFYLSELLFQDTQQQQRQVSFSQAATTI